jgi:hypothetical protein
MHRNYTRVVKPAGDFGFEHKTLASPGHLGQVAVHEFQGNMAMQTDIGRLEDHAKPPLRMKTEVFKPGLQLGALLDYRCTIVSSTLLAAGAVMQGCRLGVVFQAGIHLQQNSNLGTQRVEQFWRCPAKFHKVQRLAASACFFPLVE